MSNGHGGDAHLTVSDILDDLDTPPSTPTPPPGAARRAAAPPPQQQYGSHQQQQLMADDSLLGPVVSDPTEEATVVSREDTALPSGELARDESSFLRDMLGTPKTTGAQHRQFSDTGDVTLGRPDNQAQTQQSQLPSGASPAPRAPPSGMTPAERAEAAVARYNDGLATEESLPGVSRQLSLTHRSVSRRLQLGRQKQHGHARVNSMASSNGGIGGSTFRERLLSSSRVRGDGGESTTKKFTPPTSGSASPERIASGAFGDASPRESAFGLSYRSTMADTDNGGGANIAARTLHSVFSPSWRAGGLDVTMSGTAMAMGTGGPTAFARLAAIETSRRKTLELRQAETLAGLAMNMAMRATNVLSRMQSIASSEDARGNTLRFSTWLEDRLSAVDASVEEKVTLLARASQHHQQPPLPDVSASTVPSVTVTSGGGPALPPLTLSGAALERHQQRMLMSGGGERPGHRRTTSGQASESSFASGAVGGGSFAYDAGNTPQNYNKGGNPHLPQRTGSSAVDTPLSPTAGNGGVVPPPALALTPRSTARARSASVARKSGIFASSDFASPPMPASDQQQPHGGGSGSKPPPPKSHERPEAHRKVLAAGRIAADPNVSVSPPVRVDQVTSEAQRWQAEDFGDYARFSAVQVFLYGAAGCGKSSVAHCLTNKPPTFFKSAPKVDAPTIGVHHTLHRFRNLKLPTAPIPLGGFDDQKRVDVKGLMRAAAAANRNGGNAATLSTSSVQQSSAVMRVIDVPMHVLERWTAPGSLPVRGAVHCLVFDLSANARESRRELSRIVRHVLASSAAAAFPLPTVVVDGHDGEAPPRSTTTSAHAAADFHTDLRPLRVSFTLIGTHRDKLPTSKADDVAMQSALREEREWLLRHFDELTVKRARAGADGTAESFTSCGSPVVTAHLVDSYAVSVDKWTVVGERPRSATSFPDLAEELFTSALLHSPTAPVHIASTVMRHCGAAMLNEIAKADAASAAAMMNGGDDDNNTNNDATDENMSPRLNPAASVDAGGAGSGISSEARAMIQSAVKVELVRALTVPLQHGISDGASDGSSDALTDSAPLTIEQAFPQLQRAFVAERSAMAKEQRARGSTATTASTTADGPSLSAAAAADAVDEAAAGLLQGSTSMMSPTKTAVNLSRDALPKTSADAARYLFTALSFGIATLFTSLQRWCDFAGCVLDGVIFQGLVTQHLHLKSAATKLIEVAMAVAAGSDSHASIFGWDAAVVDALRDDLARDLCRRMCASVLAVGRARGILCLADTVLAAGCNAVVLGPTLPHHVVSLLHFPRMLLSLCLPSGLSQPTYNTSAIKAFVERAAEKEGLAISDAFSANLIRALQELHDHAELESRIGVSAAAARPPSASASNMRLVFELFAAGYVNVKLLDQLVRAPLDALLLPDALHVLMGPRLTGLTTLLPNGFVTKVRLPVSGGVLCTPDRDVLVPALALPLSPGLGSFIAFAMVTAAEDGDACLTGSVVISTAPLGFAARAAVAFANATADYLVSFRAWHNGFVADLCTIQLSDGQRTALANHRPHDPNNESKASTADGLFPDGARVFHIFVGFDDTGASETRARVCVSISKKRPTPAEHQPAPETALCGGDVFDVESVFDQVLLPVIDREAHRFGRSTSALCPADASVLCNVTSTTDVGYAQRSMPWDALVSTAREMLVGVPRPAADASLDALRKMREGSSPDRTLRPVLEPVLQYST